MAMCQPLCFDKRMISFAVSPSPPSLPHPQAASNIRQLTRPVTHRVRDRAGALSVGLNPSVISLKNLISACGTRLFVCSVIGPNEDGNEAVQGR